MDVREEKGYVIMEMDPYIAKDSVPGICEQLDPHLQKGSDEFVIDMWEAKTMNSSMASVIVHIIRHVKTANRHLCAVNVSPSVMNALTSLHLTDLLKVYETALDLEIEKGVEIQSISH